LNIIKVKAKTLQKEAKRVYKLKIKLNNLRIALQAINNV